MSKNLVIVESPAKAKTIEKFLGSEYKVVSSNGHIADLPSNELGIDLENNYNPKYKIANDKKELVKKLKKELKGVDTVWLASDEDREGEALLALGLAERLYGIQKEFKEDLSNALLRREALLRLVDPVCLGNFKWFVFNKFKEKEMNINSTCLR